MADQEKKEELQAELIAEDIQAQVTSGDDGEQFPSPPITRSSDKRRILFEELHSEEPTEPTTPSS